MLAVPQAFTQYYSWLPFTVCLLLSARPGTSCHLLRQPVFEGFYYYHPHFTHGKIKSWGGQRRLCGQWVAKPMSALECLQGRHLLSPHTLWAWREAGSAAQFVLECPWDFTSTSPKTLVTLSLVSKGTFMSQTSRCTLQLLEDSRIDI